MTPRELVEAWRTRADGYVGGEWGPPIASTYRGCATELEEALAETGDGWMPLADAPLGVILEVWGPKLPGSPASPESARWYPSGGKVMYAQIDNENEREWTKKQGFTHARRVPPPPGESDA